MMFNCYYYKVIKAVFTLQVLPDACTIRERYASGCPCTHCVGFVRYTKNTWGGVLSGRERYASGWRCSVNASGARVGYGSDAPSVYVCRLTYLFPVH